MRIHILLTPAVIVLILCTVQLSALASDHTWIGSSVGSNDWSVGSNWLEGAPTANEAGTVRLIFPTNATSLVSNNDITFTVPIEIQFTPHNTDPAYLTNSDVGAYTITGNTFQLTSGGIISTSASSNIISNGIQLPSNGSVTVNFSSGGLTLSGAITGTASTLVKDGNATLTFSSTPANTGVLLNVMNGLVVLNKSGTANAVDGIVGIATSATVRLLGTVSSTDQIADTGSVSGVVGTFDLKAFSEVTRGLAGTNQGTFTNNGATTATLTLGAGNSTYSYGGTLTNGTGVLALAKSGTGTVTLTASNGFTGGLSINNGTFQMGNAGTLNLTTPNSVAFASNGNAKVLALNGFDLQTPSVTATGASPNATVLNGSSAQDVVLTINSSADSTFNGVLADGGSGRLRFFKTGTATVNLGGNNTFTDGVVVDSGEVVITNVGGMNSTTPNRLTFPMNANAKTFTLQNVSLAIVDIFSPTGGGSKTIRNNGSSAVLTIQQNTNVNYDGVFTGSLALVKSGTSALTLSGSNTFTGGLTIDDGGIIVGNAAALNSTTPQTVAFGANTNTKTLSLNGFHTTIGGLSTGTPVGSAIVRNNHASTPATLTVSTPTAMTFGGVLNDGSTAALNLVKSGIGALTLTQSNTFTGTTAIDGGTLVVDGQLGTGAVNANNGGTLSGSGIIGGPVNINAGGIVNPFTAGTAGQFTLIDNLTLNGTYAVDIAAAARDQLSVGSAHAVSISAGSTLAFNTVSQPTAISYDILASASPRTGTFTNVTGVPSGYVVRYVGDNVRLVRVPRVASVTSTTTDGSYGVGSTINVTVNFSEMISLAGGNLNVALDSGAMISIAPFSNASSASATYTIAAGQNSADLNSTALTLSSGATLQNSVSEDAILTIPSGQSLKDSKVIIVDSIAPTVTIEQATTQVDPTPGPVIFTVTFSDPVTGFDATDITLGGTAGATTAEVSGSGAVYTVSVSGMNAAGTVTASIAANRAFDVAGNGNNASTSQDNSVVFEPLAFLSGPTANPTPGLVGASVQFTVSVNSSAATIAWDFGDGSTATGASVSYAYLALGVYNVSVTAMHPNGQIVTATLSFQVNRSDVPTRDTNGDGILTNMDIDSDGDGFPDEIETAANTSPVDASQTPFENQPRGTVLPISVTRKLITLNLAKDSQDSLLLAGTLPLPAEFVATEKTVITDVAGDLRTFVLKKNATAGKGNERFQLKPKRQRIPAEQDAPFTLTLKKASLKQRLLDSSPLDTNGLPTQVTVVLLFNKAYYSSTLPLSFETQRKVFRVSK